MQDSCFHPIVVSADFCKPELFTFPFHYRPHPLCILAANEVNAYVASCSEWADEVAKGKMFGVLLVESPEGEIGYLAAFSGILDGKNRHSFFVPPVYDFLQPDSWFKAEERRIVLISRKIEDLKSDVEFKRLKLHEQEVLFQIEEERTKARQVLLDEKEKRRQIRLQTSDRGVLDRLDHESQFQKAEWKRKERQWKMLAEDARLAVYNYESEIEALYSERKELSAQLQKWLFEQFLLNNAFGEQKSIYQIFQDAGRGIPPAGTGECAAPKLLQYAYLHHYRPLAMAEFWYGQSPKNELRRHGHYYPSCKSKCEPLLHFMLQGLQVEPNPMSQMGYRNLAGQIKIIYEDPWIMAINKPAGMLSVPGKDEQAQSVLQWATAQLAESDGPLLVHRLDMATSGILLIAKTKAVHQALQQLFETRAIKKRYIALLDREISESKGFVRLPLCPDPNDRPRQIVSFEYGKPAVTRYEVLNVGSGRTRIAFYPQTGRTHQLRVHAAHPEGLDAPIVGDTLYGIAAERMFLHAESLLFKHPVSGQTLRLVCPPDF